MTRPKLRSTPSSSRWPKAWHPDAKPTRLGGCWSSEYARDLAENVVRVLDTLAVRRSPA